MCGESFIVVLYSIHVNCVPQEHVRSDALSHHERASLWEAVR